MLNLIKSSFSPAPEDLIAEYFIESAKQITFEQACHSIAAESSFGLAGDASTLNPNISRAISPKVYCINRPNKTAKIAYPSSLFEPGNSPQILSTIAGNLFSLRSVKNVRLLDIHIPKSIVKSFKGPRYGIQGMRKTLKIKKRPILGTIIKPKIGLSAYDYCLAAYESWTGGMDIVVDDENLTNLSSNRFKERILQTQQKRDKAEQRTGEKKLYIPNVTAEAGEMVKRAVFANQHGCKAVLIDTLAVGFSAVQTLREIDVPIIIHAHRAMHAPITRNQKHGISMVVLAKMARLAGIDQLHIGSIPGKMIEENEDIQNIGEVIEKGMIHPKKKEHILSQQWHGTKPMFAICSGGIAPKHIPGLINYLGKDIIIQIGEAVHRHPFGARKGAMAARQALEASLHNIPIEVYAKKHSELMASLEKRYI